MPSCKSQLRVFSSLIFRHAVAFLLLTHTRGGQSQLIGQHRSVVAMVGDDVTLPCHVNPAKDAANVMLEWSRPDLNPRFVHVRRFGKDHLVDQNPSYKGRTSASMDRLGQGDMSLELSKVHLSDEGTYRCFVRELNTESSVQLVVGVGIEMTKVSSGVLQCKSKGWYPESEVSWLDAEGNLLPAGPTETVRGPDGLYAVSSRVTVEKRHNNTFTCRVQQKNINQIRETHVHVPDDFFTGPPQSSSSASIAVGLVVGVMFTLAVAFVVWRLRQHKINAKKHHVDEGTPRGGGSEREAFIGEGTMKNQNRKGMGFHVEAESQQDKPRTEDLTGRQEDRQSGNAGSGSQCVMECARQRHEVQAGGQTINDLDKTDQRTEETEAEKREEKPEKEEDRAKPEEETKSLNPQREGLLDGGGQQQQTREGGEATHETEENKEQTQGVGEGETRQNAPPAGGGTKNETETKSSQEKDAACPDEKTQSAVNMPTGQTPLAGEIKQEVQAEEKTKNELDNREDEKKTEPPGPKQETKSVNPEREGLMDGGGQQQQTREGGEATHETEENKEQTQGVGEGETRQNAPPAGGGTKNETETKSSQEKDTACPDEGEGRQEKDRDKADRGEDTTLKENTRAEGDLDGRDDDETTKSADSTRAGKEGEGGERRSEEPQSPCPPKTETQPEKSPDSRDEDIQPPGGEGQRDVEKTEEDNRLIPLTASFNNVVVL